MTFTKSTSVRSSLDAFAEAAPFFQLLNEGEGEADMELNPQKAIAAPFVPQRSSKPSLEAREIRLIPTPVKAVPIPRPTEPPPVPPQSTYKPAAPKKQG